MFFPIVLAFVVWIVANKRVQVYYDLAAVASEPVRSKAGES